MRMAGLFLVSVTVILLATALGTGTFALAALALALAGLGGLAMLAVWAHHNPARTSPDDDEWAKAIK